ncbi:gastrula zinc finger protein XlCGF66.1-like [Leptodactylus fuscus]|uniref:gastrula zinc finger protein XlCGF66.1-like n=1 Tax=Leptodactylus fuscus TaxID=238119 RepID=UPI003F4F2C6C
MAEEILELSLEIIYLLTGEDYMVVKKPDEYLTTSADLKVSPRWSKSQSRIMEPPPESLIDLRPNKQKILELTRKILQMLTREVPIRYQDVTVHFSMEEWEYLEEHKDLYKDIMMEDHQSITPQVKMSALCIVSMNKHPCLHLQ